MRRITKLLVSLALVMLAVVLVLSGCAKAPAPKAQTAAEFYKNNTLTVICPQPAGGGTDYAARVFAAYWPDYSGGAAIVVNVVGGAAIVGNNQLYKAKPDGLSIGAEEGPTVFSPVLFGEPGIEYDVNKWEWLGMFGQTTEVLVPGKHLPFKTAAELKGAKGMRFGAVSPMGHYGAGAVMVATAFNMQDAILVSGYSGSGDIALAIARKEIDLSADADFYVQTKSVPAGQVGTPLLAISDKRSPLFPDAPALTEVVNLTPLQQRYLALSMAIDSHKSFLTPPGVPQDRLDYLRAGFDATMKNAAFVAAAKKQWPDWQTPWNAAQYSAFVKQVMSISKDDVAAFRVDLDKLMKK